MPQRAIQYVLKHSAAGAALREAFFSQEAAAIDKIAIHMAIVLAKGHKILLCGNGASAAIAQLMASQFVNRFQLDRPALPAVALTADSSVITAIAGNHGLDHIFAKQIMAMGAPGDMLVAITSSVSCANIINALDAARSRNLISLCITCRDGAEEAEHSDLSINVPHQNVPIIQELHLAIGNMLCALTDHYLFENVAALKPHLEALPGSQTANKNV